MPLLQPPAEQPFSQIPPNWNPVSNDRVLSRLDLIHSVARVRIAFSLLFKKLTPADSYEFVDGLTNEKRPLNSDPNL
ncbi:MAG: hypothetical protein QOK48_1083 [Blastocatellia bacterium]|jgi:hypothetical protein|nr:hypothetical protein [Blastocatellia bacterium]